MSQLRSFFSLLEAAPLGQRLRPCGIPCGHVAEPHVADLAGAHQVVQSAHDLLGGCDAIPCVQDVQIDVVGLQSPQRALDRTQDVLASVAAGVRVARLGVEAELGGEHHAVARLALGDQLSEPLLARATGVEIGGVDEVAARIQVGVQ